MAVRSYNPRQVSYIYAGSIIEGFADGTFINVARNEDSASYQRGAQGGGTRTLTSDKSGRVTATLQQTSPSNATFSAQLAAQELSGGGIASGVIKDDGGNDLHDFETGWIVRPADADYANELSNREWIVETDSLGMQVLGQSA